MLGHRSMFEPWSGLDNRGSTLNFCGRRVARRRSEAYGWAMPDGYPVQVEVEYPDRPLNRLTTGLRIFTIIPIAIVLATVSGETWARTAATTPARPRGW